MKNKKINDIILILSLFLLSFSEYFFLPKEKGGRLLVYKDNLLIDSLDLSKNKTYKIEGMEIFIENREAFVKNSACPDKICEKTPKIKNKGQAIICVPQKIVLKVAGDEFDAVV